MNPDKIEKGFQIMDETIAKIQESLDTTFFDAYIENVENLVDGGKVRVIDNQPEEKVAQKIERLYRELIALELEPEERRKLTQLVLLKGSRQENLQANHQLTPDTLGFLFVFLLERLFPNKQQALTILDISVGMANLLLTTILNLQIAGRQVSGYGVDADETLLAIAAADSELTQADVHFFHQDSLHDLLIDPVDAVIADLPIGFYPDDERAENFVTSADEGHSYAHHLLMEQGMRYVKENGFGIFLVPTNFLETEQSFTLEKWFGSEVYLQGIIQLPEELFKNKQSGKSILLLQNRGAEAKQADQVLLVNLATLKDPKAIAKFLQEFEDWKSSNL